MGKFQDQWHQCYCSSGCQTNLGFAMLCLGVHVYGDHFSTPKIDMNLQAPCCS